MDAKGLARAMIAELVRIAGIAVRDDNDRMYRTGMFDMTTHAVSVAYDMTPEHAREYLSEEIQEGIAAQC